MPLSHAPAARRPARWTRCIEHQRFPRFESGALALRVATIGINQLGASSRRKPDVRPPFCRVTGFEWWANHAGCDEFVEAAGRALRRCTWRDKLRDHAAMSRDRNTLAGLNPPNVAAQVVFEFADACGSHRQSIAICGHIRQARSISLKLSPSTYSNSEVISSSSRKKAPANRFCRRPAPTRPALRPCAPSGRADGGSS